jgi:hypothetical protein
MDQPPINYPLQHFTQSAAVQMQHRAKVTLRDASGLEDDQQQAELSRR